MPELSQIQQPLLHLVYATAELPRPDQDTLFMRIHTCDEALNAEKMHLSWDINKPQQLLGEIRFQQHRIHIAGLANPLPPELMDRTIHTTTWQPQIKASMRQHSAHLSLVYAGADPNPIEKMIAIYQTAHAFKTPNLLGVINPKAWTAHPPAEFLCPNAIRRYRQQFPYNLWVGKIKFFIDKQRYWLVTKGHHIFDAPDLAYFIQSGESSEDIIRQFNNIFFYMYQQDVNVTAGDTLTVGKNGIPMQFGEVTEYPKILMGPSGTLVIKKLNQDMP